MPESTESKPLELRITKRRAVFTPRIMGVFIFLIIILSLAAGALRAELALILSGAVFLVLWVYCLAMTLLLALLHYRRTRRAVIRVSPREISAGERAEAIYAEGEAAAFKGRIFQLPGIAVRCRLLLATADNRKIQYDFSIGDSSPHFFTAEKRGAYFSDYSEFAVFDVLGFFRFAFRIHTDRLSAEDNALLLVSPCTAQEAPPVNARAGESMLKPEFSFQRTDNLIDHRPYVPGDDPRRINWKLYSHGGGLFVREGEFEPPPQSNIIILVDTEYDPLLYRNPEAACDGIDLLCENALAAALACAESGMEVHIGYTHGAVRKGNAPALMQAQIASSLAWPAALNLSAMAELPAAPDDCGVLILALPRSSAEPSAIDRFLNSASRRSIELLFLYNRNTAHSELISAAETCTIMYNRRSGVRARIIGV